MSVTEQRYKAVQGVLADGRTVNEVAGDWGVSRRTMHRWLARYEGDGLEGLGDRSHRPAHCPHQMPAAIEVMVLPAQVLTDNGKVFTGRYAQPPVEVLFDRICRENGIDHLLTMPLKPTTTGKIERFHRTLRAEFDTRQVFRNLKTAQEALDEWVTYYNTQRPHQALSDLTPESRFSAGGEEGVRHQLRHPERNGEQWVCRKVASNGVVSVGYQQVSVGKHYGGSACDVLVTDGLLQFWVGNELLKTVARTSKGAVRKLHADGTAPQR